MTDAELDARVAALSDEDVRGILDGTDGARLLWYRPRAVQRRMASELLRLREENAALKARLAAVDPPRGACGYRAHHADCDCGGVGGDR